MQILKVLIIEDEPHWATLLQNLLDEASDDDLLFLPLTATTLAEGLEELSRGPVDAILLDLFLPDCKGMETFDRVNVRFPMIPVVITSGLESTKLALETLRAGAQDYLIKGVGTGQTLRRILTYSIERKKLERQKDDFVGTVTHEMRTPLTVVKTAAANLLDPRLGDLSEKQKRVVAMIGRNADQLVRIINDMLDLSRLQSRKATVRRVELGAAYLHELVANHQFTADAKGLKLVTDIPSDLAHFYGDRDLIYQVFNNLLSNAIRYARTQVTVTARVGDAAGLFGLSVVIQDDGPGIAPDQLGKLFQKFVQVDRAAGGSEYKGTGLGLSVCKEIVDLHGGKIWAESVVGEHTSFHFILPMRKKSRGPKVS